VSTEHNQSGHQQIVSPAAQEALADQATSQVNIQTQANSDEQDEINADRSLQICHL
jgi:hypothetical protein